MPTLKQALKRAEEELAEIEARVAEQRRIVEGLRFAVDRYADEPKEQPARDASRMSRTDAILEILAGNMATPLSVSDLTPLVGSLRGTAETSNAVSAALSYLKEQGRVRVEPGHGWMHAEAPRLPRPGDVDPDDIPF